MVTAREVCQQVHRLNGAQLEAAAAFLADLLATEDAEDQDQDGAGPDRQNGRGSAAGWVELKTINGHGPYAYQRWREGKRTRSKYLGKVKDLGSASVPVNGKVAP